MTVRDAAGIALHTAGAARVHLFLAMPGGLAFLLGHRWNALAPTLL